MKYGHEFWKHLGKQPSGKGAVHVNSQARVGRARGREGGNETRMVAVVLLCGTAEAISAWLPRYRRCSVLGSFEQVCDTS
jgi:hypothetical protein